MKTAKRRYSPEFKAKVAIEAIKGKFTVAELSEKYDVHQSLIHSWKRAVMDSAPAIMEKGTKGMDAVDELCKEKERQVERLRQENEWLQKVLMKLSPAERMAAVETDNPQLPLLRQVKLLDINRSSIYYRKRSMRDDEHKIAT